MKTWLFCVALIAFVPVNALAQETLVSFNAGIGVIPVQGTTGTSPNLVVVQNIVRGVNPPAAPWRIASLLAYVYTDGDIVVDGHGLRLAGGNGIGTNPVPNVLAKLFCGPADSATEFDSPVVPMNAKGNFDISGSLSATPPDPCTDPVLLIVASTTSGSEPWLAAGIPKKGQ
jgi:hypothetical protein